MLLSDRQGDDLLWSFDWQSFKDPYPAAWLIVGLYFFAAILCGVCWARRKRISGAIAPWRAGLFWALVCLGLLVLGLNKQLDLHVMLMDVSRPILDERGWYDTRDEWLPFVVAAIAVLGLICVAGAVLVMRGLWSRVWLVVLGAGVLCLFVFERSFSIWVKKLPMEQEVWPNVQVNHLIESAGIALIIGGALWNLLRQENRRSTPQSGADLTD